MAMADNTLAAIGGFEIRMIGEKIRHLSFYRLRQEATRPLPEDFGELVVKGSWLNQFDNVIVRHGISLLWWRSGGSSTPTICRPSDSRRHQLSAIPPCRLYPP